MKKLICLFVLYSSLAIGIYTYPMDFLGVAAELDKNEKQLNNTSNNNVSPQQQLSFIFLQYKKGVMPEKNVMLQLETITSAQYLLENTKDEGGNTFLHLATQKGHDLLLKELIETYHMNSSAKNNSNQTAGDIINAKIRDHWQDDNYSNCLVVLADNQESNKNTTHDDSDTVLQNIDNVYNDGGIALEEGALNKLKQWLKMKCAIQ